MNFKLNWLQLGLVSTLVSTFVVSGLLAQEAEAKSKKISIMFWNVENLFDTIDDPNKKDEEFTPEGPKEWTEEKLALKMSHLAEVISSVTSFGGQKCPDFVGLAEVENAQVLRTLNRKYLAECKYDKIIIDPKDPDMRGIKTAALTRLNITERPRAHATYAGGRFINEIKLQLGEANLTVFLNHWKSRLTTGEGNDAGADKRALAANILRKRVLEITEQDPAADLIAMGDFNDEPENDSLKKVLGSTMNLQQLVDHPDSLVFWNPSAEILRLPAFAEGLGDPEVYSLYRRARGTYYFGREKQFNQIDNFHVSPGLLDDQGVRYQPLSYQVVRHKKYSDQYGRPIPFSKEAQFRGASDHLPIKVDMFVEPSL